MTGTFLLFAAVILAYTNGANDNFKGVATLYGGKVLSYSAALRWAIVTTMAGSLTSLFLASKLVKLFSGHGIVNSAVLADPRFLIVVALSAGIVVLTATVLGMPVSTTHSLLGSLAGAGIVSGGLASWTVLGKSFLFPLILGPVVAVGITLILYKMLHVFRLGLGIDSSFVFASVTRRKPLSARRASTQFEAREPGLPCGRNSTAE